MDSTLNSIAEIEEINIGQIIEEELRRQEQTVAWFSRCLNCDRRNVYDIFNRQFIDTGLLYRICLILKKDFFSIYSQRLNQSHNQDFTL